MKIKTIVLGWILLSITQIGNSQVSFGVQTGISFFKETQFDVPSNLHNPDLPNRFTNGYYVALITNIPIKNNFSIQGEISFIRKGGIQIRKDHVTLGPDYGFRLEDRYLFIEVPIIGKYHFSINNQFGFELGLGASVGYLTQYKYLFTENNRTNIFILELPKVCANCHPINRWDISPILDISFPTQAPFGEFIVGLRGSMDLKKLRSPTESLGQTISLGQSYNWGMVFYAGYSFNKNNFKKNRIPKSELE